MILYPGENMFIKLAKDSYSGIVMWTMRSLEPKQDHIIMDLPFSRPCSGSTLAGRCLARKDKRLFKHKYYLKDEDKQLMLLERSSHHVARTSPGH